MIYLKNKNTFFKHIVIIPILTILGLPILFLDICIEIYHRICFPLYNFNYVKRGNYIKIFDRGKLKYLSFWQKLYCMYCGYGNGVIQYWREIANQTEKYWCGVKHQSDAKFIQSDHQDVFADYGNEKDFNEKYKEKEN